MPEANRTTCPHCGASLERFELPDTLYDHPYDLACFNDDCPYYVRGWTWMSEKFGVNSSYRYRIDSQSGHASPIPVWSPTALRSRIISESEPVGGGERSPRE